MKKIFTLLTLSLALITGIKAQPSKDFHNHEVKINWREILAPKPALGLGFSSVSEARTIINDILDVVGMQQNFTIVPTTQVGNAAAMTYGGKRYILYNPSFINSLDRAAQDKWASISVLAHEIGHHLLGHTLGAGGNSSHARELAADEFSGLVLAKMGASLKQAQLAMSLIGDPYGSASHPGESQRLAAIARGYAKGGGKLPDDVAVNQPAPAERSTRTYPTQESRRVEYPQQPSRRVVVGWPQQRRSSTASAAIVYQLRLSNGSQLYVTNQNTVVKPYGNSYQVVARLAGTNNRNYPYVIYDNDTQLYVDRTGTVYTDTGKRVGVMTQA